MQRDDISRLYKYLGQPSQNYLDFQTEDDFRERIDRVASRRRGLPSVAGTQPAPGLLRQSKIVAIVSVGHLPGRKLVGSLAWIASRRLRGRVPVHIVDLIPVNEPLEDQSILRSNGIRHVLIDTSDQVVRMEATREIAWLERQIAADHDDGLIFVDVPEQVMHARHQALAAADIVLVLVPDAMSSVRAIEDVELELGELASLRRENRLHYLLVDAGDFESLPPLLHDELMSHEDLFVPVRLSAESFPGARELANGSGLEQGQHRELLDICDFIFGRIAHEDR